MDTPDFASTLRECGVSDENITKLVDGGWSSALIAASSSTADGAQLPEILCESPGHVGPLQNAALRLCWVKASQSLLAPPPIAASATAPASSSIPADS